MNVIEGWQGEVIRISDVILLIRSPRRISTGVPPGFSDLFVVSMGGRVSFVECKKPGGSVRPEQTKFLEVMRQMGCRAGIARSVEDAIEIVEGGKTNV